eukprot:9273815-Pyramimonas_sp.AAC.1
MGSCWLCSEGFDGFANDSPDATRFRPWAVTEDSQRRRPLPPVTARGDLSMIRHIATSCRLRLLHIRCACPGNEFPSPRRAEMRMHAMMKKMKMIMMARVMPRTLQSTTFNACLVVFNVDNVSTAKHNCLGFTITTMKRVDAAVSNDLSCGNRRAA